MNAVPQHKGEAVRALDLFYKAGGASMGLHRAGFDVIGVDIEPQPHYPFTFVQADALTFPLEGFSFIWASPKCQRHSTMTKRWEGRSVTHEDQIPTMRERLKLFDHVIENVPTAPIRRDLILCGSMFGLPLRRHRHFESNLPMPLALPCDHSGPVVGVYGHAGGRSLRDGIYFGGTDAWRMAMGIDWMTGNELAQAIPPAYSEFIGRHVMRVLSARAIPEGS